jgi:hypothetical protein
MICIFNFYFIFFYAREKVKTHFVLAQNSEESDADFE